MCLFLAVPWAYVFHRSPAVLSGASRLLCVFSSRCHGLVFLVDHHLLFLLSRDCCVPLPQCVMGLCFSSITSCPFCCLAIVVCLFLKVSWSCVSHRSPAVLSVVSRLLCASSSRCHGLVFLIDHQLSFLLSRDCCVPLSRRAINLSAICDCGIFPIMLTIFVVLFFF